MASAPHALILCCVCLRRRTPKKYKKQTEINWLGLAAYVFFYCAFVFYMWIRIAKTLDLGLYLGAHLDVWRQP